MSKAKGFPGIRKRLGPSWWLSNRHYTAYMVRELTSFFVAVFSLLYVYQIVQLTTGSSAYSNYLGLLRNPAMVLLSIVVLGFTLYHSLTWFYLIGHVTPIKVGGRTTTPRQALAVNTILLLIISYVVIRLFLLKG